MTLPASLPPVIPQPFAQNAPGGNINNPIPNTTSTSGLASYDQGWPTVTMQPVVGGGIPPEGQDFNGIFFAVTAHLYYLQSGQRWPFNADVATAIGGYPVGAIVAMADGTGEWINAEANNTRDPDASGAISTNGWQPLTTFGYTDVSGLTGAAPVGLTGVQSKKPLIVFSGTLVANQQVSLPDIPFEWLLVNLCTGPFVLTVGAGAGGGTTVSVPQGGYGSPLGVYGIGDGNIYPSVSPLGVPISIATAPLTLVERDGSGNVYGLYFFMTAGVDNQSIVNVITDSGNGAFRKNTLANFESQMALSAIGGQVTAGQVPQAAVTQYAPAILASAALTGSPTTPTQARGNSSTLVASTAFVNPGTSANANGYRLMPDNTLEQWGAVTSTSNAGLVAIGFNIPFPNACWNVVFSSAAPTGVGGAGSREEYLNAAPTTAGFGVREVAASNNAITIYWRAVGN